jgi:hypothetical protein
MIGEVDRKLDFDPFRASPERRQRHSPNHLGMSPDPAASELEEAYAPHTFLTHATNVTSEGCAKKMMFLIESHPLDSKISCE